MLQMRGSPRNILNSGNPSESQVWVFARIRTRSTHFRPQLWLHPLPVRKSTCLHLLERPRPASNFDYVCQIFAEIHVHSNLITLPMWHPKLRQRRTSSEHSGLILSPTSTSQSTGEWSIMLRSYLPLVSRTVSHRYLAKIVLLLGTRLATRAFSLLLLLTG